jgi:Na+/melibiose symporter-like transporter
MLGITDLPTYLVGLTGLVLALSKGGLSGWNSPLVLGGFAAAVVLLPLFVLVERRGRAPMLDLTIFENRLFAAATGAAFINGLSRFALLFVFVFYFQGVHGDDPITAGIKLSPMAIGMLISSPLAGIWADRRGSRSDSMLGLFNRRVNYLILQQIIQNQLNSAQYKVAEQEKREGRKYNPPAEF